MASATIKEINDEQIWTRFLDAVQPATFAQSWAWKKYQESLGHETETFGWYEDDRLLGVCLAIKSWARRGRIYSVPHGPIAVEGRLEAALKIFTPFLIGRASRWGAHWIRLAPLITPTPSSQAFLKSLGWRSSPTHLHAERSMILDLSPSAAELLRNMRKTTRQEIEKSKKVGLEVEIGLESRLWQAFESNYRETVRRQKFLAYSVVSIQREVQAFKASGGVILAVVWQKGQPLASAVILIVHGSAFYHHGASATASRHLPAPHALQWALILEAKKRGCRFYNFWGVSPGDRKNHPWSGLSVFKRGFGGREHVLVPTQDYILRPSRYWLIWFFETLMRKWKGL